MKDIRVYLSVIVLCIISSTSASEYEVKDILIADEYYFNDEQNLAILDLRESKLDLNLKLILSDSVKEVPLVACASYILISAKRNEIIVAGLYYDNEWLLQKVAKFDTSKTKMKNLVLNLYSEDNGFGKDEDFYEVKGEVFIKKIEFLLREKAKAALK